MASGCVRRIVAGQLVEIGSWRARRTDGSFADAWNRNNQFGNLEQSGNREGERLLWNFLQALKPTFCELLLPAHGIERYDLDHFRIVEVCLRGVVECQVSIFADAKQTELRTCGAKLFSIFLPHPIEIGGSSVNLGEFSQGNARGQILAQIAAGQAG